MNPDFSRMTPQAVKCYHEGLAIVKRKLSGCPKPPTAEERHAASIDQGNEIIRRKVGISGAMKHFNVPPPRSHKTQPPRIEAVIQRIERNIRFASVK
jgi:hypothetical protein